MKSPFPGMDPYLEDAAVFPDFHFEMIGAMRAQLGAKVSPNFFVRVQERIYLTEPDFGRRGYIVPDITIVKQPRPASERLTASGAITAPTLIEPLFDPEIRDHYLEILDAQSREVIATIELMSPINKRKGALGYEDFWRKRRELFESQVHWIEIDLLREGERPYRLWGKSDYYALLKRGGQWDKLEVWFFNLCDKMPTIAVPLRPPFEDVPLDLQAAFEATYERARYADSVDYTREPPPPPLRPEDARWAQERVRAWLAAAR